MPPNMVHTPAEEKDWDRAKQIVKDQGHGENWDLVNYIYQNIRNNKGASAGAAAADPMPAPPRPPTMPAPPPPPASLSAGDQRVAKQLFASTWSMRRSRP